ncbi:Na(+)/H(+) antiporter 2 [Saccharata proteae CBS 121410]|uniref:Na(+)/H(+) antiporter 2 n=1 Tax=Saccharata proteae CBS 121410 TaxID=1314787 RepID=A0A9P4M2C6_9PEZI|nr:Na(+)/H(+) antiporter 2 [Saccharata proteae CBS 121410]
MGVWKQLEPSGPHLTYIVLSSFLIIYALFSLFIKNRLHLSEPPLATLFGIAFGPAGVGVLDPRGWGLNDIFIQEFTRIILGVQCFTVGVELPAHYFNGHWKSVAMMLGPVMAFGWVVCAALIYLLLKVDFTVALIIAACLTPTDPVLAASVLSNSQFSTRIPKRVRHLLSAESGCNDGVSFPFIYVGLSVLTRSTVGGMLKKWFLITILYQCVVGVLMGLFVGHCANRLLRFSDGRNMVGRGSYLVFYILLAIFSVGLASTLGIDDFLLAFSAGIGFANDGWFSKRITQSKLPLIIDLLLNSTMFVYFGAQIPWSEMNSIRNLSPGLLFGLLVLVLLLRRIPIVLLLKRFIPDIHTYREALFCGHFGPMGVAALFLAIEARAQLENDTSEPMPNPPHNLPHRKQHAIDIIWPVICFIVLGSTMVHGLSTLAISVGSHYTRAIDERAPLIGAETDPLSSMRHDTDDEEEE